ncbi:yellowish-green 1-like protein [Cercophora newfieldiana]|uniref:Yellowish-green 1-like protein n=1 Tax=Cercophora newfieldiana TaxID=92897 RepID=A0AA40CTF0_9PEZI|nr:yellowish-green 1-like protein [Cercophora newfieldiana]
MAPQQYFIGDAINKPAIHHESFQKLWETKWRAPCAMGVYPFMFGSLTDFEPIAQSLIAAGLKPPYDWDVYASHFFPFAETLVATAEEALASGNREKASEYFLRASAVYRIGRFPAIRTEKQREAWRLGKEVFYKGAGLMEFPIREVLVGHRYKKEGEGDVIPVNLLVPEGEGKKPVVLIFTGLDGHRTELAVWQRGWLEKGVATVVVEIPGTGDSPADAKDPESPDRQWSSVLDWIAEQDQLDERRVVVWGFSTGGYYSLRAGHTHADRLLGVVSQGGGCHHMFDREWLSKVNVLEFPFDLANALAFKWGYASLDEFIQEAGKFSLVNDGTLEKKSCAVLLVNGKEDEIFPIEDLYVALEHGGPKLARAVAGKKHMGEPEAFFIILEWIHGLLGLDGDFMSQMRGLPSKMKY